MLIKTLKLAAPARTADDNVATTTVKLANSNPPKQTRKQVQLNCPNLHFNYSNG